MKNIKFISLFLAMVLFVILIAILVIPSSTVSEILKLEEDKVVHCSAEVDTDWFSDPDFEGVPQCSETGKKCSILKSLSVFKTEGNLVLTDGSGEEYGSTDFAISRGTKDTITFDSCVPKDINSGYLEIRKDGQLKDKVGVTF